MADLLSDACHRLFVINVEFLSVICPKGTPGMLQTARMINPGATKLNQPSLH